MAVKTARGEHHSPLRQAQEGWGEGMKKLHRSARPNEGIGPGKARCSNLAA